MIHRPVATAFLALLAAAQLVLLPLASGSPCGLDATGGAGECCCAAARSEAGPAAPREAESPGCCGEEAPRAPDGGPRAVAAADGCGCTAAPAPAPATPPESSQLLRGGDVAAVAPARGWEPHAAARVEACAPPPRVRPPGSGRPLHLLHQAFLL